MNISKDDINLMVAKICAPLVRAVEELKRASAAPVVAKTADEARIELLQKSIEKLQNEIKDLNKASIEEVGDPAVFEGCLGADAVINQFDDSGEGENVFSGVITPGFGEFEPQGTEGVFDGILTSVPRRAKSAHAGGQVSPDAMGVQGLRKVKNFRVPNREIKRNQVNF